MTIDTLSSLMNLFVWGVGAVYIVDRLMPTFGKKILEVLGLITLVILAALAYTEKSVTKFHFRGGTTISIEVPK